MLPIWTRDEARQADEWAQSIGVPYSVLLAMAGFQLARYIYSRHSADRIVILAGSGSNGGDGWVAARHLASRHVAVTVVPMGEPRFPGAADWVRAAKAEGAEVAHGLHGQTRLKEADLVVDAVYGTGFHGSILDSLARPWLVQASSQGVPIVAVDIPSGVNADTGAYEGPKLNIQTTVTMGAAKWGLLGYPALGMIGELVTADIGLARRSYTDIPGAWLDPKTARQHLPQPGLLAHKYQRGHVIVIGGSRSMPGAPWLAAMAALKSGAGLVEVVMPAAAESLAPLLSAALIRHGVSDNADGALIWSEELKRIVARADALVVGPGLGKAADPRILYELSQLDIPTVVDADALRMVSSLKRVPSHWVMTPHAGELGALLGEDAARINADRRGAVLRFRSLYSCPILLKGRFSLVGDDSHLWAVPTGHVALATAGSGDVLSGMVARLLAGGLSGGDALALGAYWHGWAGELGGQTEGLSLTAVDLLDWIRPARQAIEARQDPAALVWWN